MSVNEKIKQYIEDHGITQKFLCDKTGISIVTMSKIINSNRKVTGEELILIAKALDVSANIFLD
ncbi:MAG: helix-turn-helix domain-containing protein [Acholeplasmatales bacterium]|nr:helix-turn-helix domain-containing protein [Acholeplasmatales bacterium]